MGNICCNSSSSATTTTMGVGVGVEGETNWNVNQAVVNGNKANTKSLLTGKIDNNNNNNNNANNIRVSAHPNDVEIHHDQHDQHDHHDHQHRQQMHRENSDATVYHDAIMDRFPSSYDMSYPPTNSMRQSMFLNEIDLDLVLDQKRPSKMQVLLKKGNSSRNTLIGMVTKGSSSSQRRQVVIDDNDNDNNATSTDAVVEPPPTLPPPPPPHLRQSVIQIKTNLQKEHAGLKSSQTDLSGYPGELTEEELEICIEFREQLKTNDHTAYKEMVLSMHPHEKEAFALCRFLRSRNFIINNVFEMLKEKNQAYNWNAVSSSSSSSNSTIKSDDKNEEPNSNSNGNPFYKNLHDIDAFNNCPLSVFLTQYPMIHTGIGKNGAIIVYFKAGQVSVPGVECIVGDMVNALPFVWNQLYHETRNAIEREINKHNSATTTTVLAEKIIIIDLKGDTTLFSDGIEFLKSVPIAASCFPESVNRTYVLNAPFSFRLIWSVISHTLEARTLQKIGFFSTITKAKSDFSEHIELNELLSDYGGTNNISYNDVLAKRQCELSHKPGIVTRYIVELMCITAGGGGGGGSGSGSGSRSTMDFDFNLQNNEKIDSIVIYSRSLNGCEFSVTSKNSNNKDDGIDVVVVDPIYVNRDADNNNNKPNYAIEIASSKDMLSYSDEGGNTEQQYTIHAKDGTAKDYFLIAISIAKV